MKYINYDRFRPHLVKLSDFTGPQVGDPLVDVEFYDLEGNKRALSSFLGRPIVLEAGSYTCPMYCKGVSTMNELAQQYPEVTFLVMYIREAHPGERTTGHKSLEQKFELAHRIAASESHRTVLIDDIDGQAHCAYGTLPNSVHIFDENGVLAYRSDWCHPPVVAQVLKHMGEKEVRFTRDHYEKIPPMNSIQILLRGGWLAFMDVVVQSPLMIYEHAKARLTVGSSRTLTRKSAKECC